MTPNAEGILQLAWTQLWQVTLLIVAVACVVRAGWVSPRR